MSNGGGGVIDSARGEGREPDRPQSLATMRGVAVVTRRSIDVLVHVAGTTGATPDGPIGLETRFQLASVSKQFTAAAVLLLVDRRALSLDDRLVGHLDGCPSTWEQITLHHLLCHTAGLVHWPHLEGLDLTASVPADELLSIFADAPLLGMPGEQYSYSSPGYVLLARVVEQVSATPYRTFLADEIFGPLGMDATFAGNPSGEPRLAVPLHDGEPVASFELDVVGMLSLIHI